MPTGSDRTPRAALLVVDVQNDFLPGGALPVPEGDAVIAPINRLMPLFEEVVASRDWHPPNHGSFASQHPGHRVGDVIELNGLPQVLWPDHCVQGTAGADYAPGLNTDAVTHEVLKGTDPGIDSYSAFFDNGHRRSTGLDDYLRRHGIDTVFVTGLATDYCVKATALDAARLGYRTYLVEDACRGVDLHPGDVQRAIEEMRAAGVRVVRSEDVPQVLRELREMSGNAQD